MTLEPLLLMTLSLVGSSLVIALGRRSLLDHAALAVPCGTAVFTVVALLSFVSPLTYRAAGALAFVSMAVVVLLVYRLHELPSGHRRWTTVSPALVWSIVIGGVSIVSRRLAQSRVTADSYEYIQGAGLFEAVGSPFDDAYLLVARQGVMAFTHSVALIGGEPFLVGLAPAFALSGLAGLVWFARQLAGPLHAREWFFLGAVTLALTSSNRVVFHAFYVNAHLMVGVHLMLLVSIGWSISRGLLPRNWMVICGLMIVPVAVARPESPVLLAIVLTPLVLSAVRDDLFAVVLVGTVVLTTWIWWVGGLGGVADWSPTGEGTVAVLSATAMLGLLAARLLPGLGGRLCRWFPWLVHGALATLLLAFTVLGDRETLTVSVTVAWSNARQDGIWGMLLLGLAVAVAGNVLGRWIPDQQAFLLPLTTFLPFAVVLAFARGHSYRLGPGDSLNRMWMHVILLACAYLIAVTCYDPRPSSTHEVRGPDTRGAPGPTPSAQVPSVHPPDGRR
jgi:hypothetical protein